MKKKATITNSVIKDAFEMLSYQWVKKVELTFLQIEAAG